MVDSLASVLVDKSVALLASEGKNCRMDSRLMRWLFRRSMSRLPSR
jgi:hypothetical protein